MSEKKPFDAVIDTLNFCLIDGDLREHTEKMIKWSRREREKQAKAAIRVLEAAGKVDKSMVLEAEFFWPHNVHVGREFGPCRKAIRALLESLPEKEKK